MTTTGTFAFNPSLGEFVLDAFGNCGVPRAALTAQHMQDARFAANLINSRWSASGVNLWSVDSQTITLIGGQATYTVDPATVFILDAYLTQGCPPIDTTIMPIGRSDYAATADKLTPGTPGVFWFDRTLAPTLTLWPVPSASDTWTLTFWRARQIMDSELAGGLTPELPFTFLDAYSWELSWRLAAKYAPDKAVMLHDEAKEAWNIATSAGTENVGVNLTPIMTGYYR